MIIQEQAELQRFVKPREDSANYSARRPRKSEIVEMEMSSSLTRSKKSRSFFEKKVLYLLLIRYINKSINF